MRSWIKGIYRVMNRSILTTYVNAPILSQICFYRCHQVFFLPCLAHRETVGGETHRDVFQQIHWLYQVYNKVIICTSATTLWHWFETLDFVYSLYNILYTYMLLQTEDHNLLKFFLVSFWTKKHLITMTTIMVTMG